MALSQTPANLDTLVQICDSTPMIRKGAVVLVLVTILFIRINTFSFAQTSSNTPVPTAKKDARVTAIQKKQERMEQRIPTVQQRITSRAEALDERKKKILERVQTHRAKVFDRAENAITRLDALWKRVESRIEKIKSRGGDVSSLDDEIAAVKVKRAAAVEAIRQAKAAYTGDTSLSDIAADTVNFRRGLTAVKTSLQAYRQSIIAVVRNLKTIKVPVSPTPTL